jgi:hypothetical protein
MEIYHFTLAQPSILCYPSFVVEEIRRQKGDKTMATDYRVLTEENTNNAIKRAQKYKARVSVKSFGLYEVVNRQNGHRYLVTLWRENGERRCKCQCQGFQSGVCHHVISAIGSHNQMCELRQKGYRPLPSNVIQFPKAA